MKRIGGRSRNPQEVQVETMKDVRFSVMGENSVAILVVKDLSLVFAQAPRGTKVKIP